MKRLLIATALLALAPLAAQAQSSSTQNFGPREGSQEITLSGTGSSNNDFDAGNFGITGSYGYYFTPAFEGGVRQSINWSGAKDADDTLNGNTRLFMDYHFNASNRFKPFIGANLGYIYGEGVSDTGIISPEVGVKYYVNSTTFILAQAEYQIFFNSGDDIGDNFDDSAFAYTIGLGFLF
ncbi:MAG TPA: outer membrane beta-barrel protein [Alphaproteobacteria bacterium]